MICSIRWLQFSSSLYRAYWYCPSALWRCWLGGRKGIQPVKIWVVWCWHGYLSRMRCRFAYGPLTISCSSKSRQVLPFCYRLTQVVPDKGPLNGCSLSCIHTWYLLTRVDPDILQTSSKTVVCVCVYVLAAMIVIISAYCQCCVVYCLVGTWGVCASVSRQARSTACAWHR